MFDVSVKDLARFMGLSTRSVMRYSHLLKIPPTRQGNCCNRWSTEDAARLVEGWKKFNQLGRDNDGLTYFERIRRVQAEDPVLQRSWAAWLDTNDKLAAQRKNGSPRRRQPVAA